MYTTGYVLVEVVVVVVDVVEEVVVVGGSTVMGAIGKSEREEPMEFVVPCPS
jgi:hypothetical protein